MGNERITPIERDPARLDEALPWYLNGSLSESDRAWVEQTLADGDADPDAPLAFDRSVKDAFERKLAELPEDIGWSRLLQRVRADTAGAASAPRAARPPGSSAAGSPGGSWLQRLADRWSTLLSPQLGMALMALVAVQTIAIGVLVSDRSGSGQPDTVSYRSADAVSVPAIRALLHETVTERRLREALSANGARIVDGPNPLGEYWIVAGERDPAQVAAALRDAGIIASFVIDQRLQRR